MSGLSSNHRKSRCRRRLAASRRHPADQHRLRVERLEDRRLLAVFDLVGGAGDGDTGSLRAAIHAANANNEDDVINLAAGNYTLSRAGAGEDQNSTGDLDLTESGHTLVIRGAGADVTTIDAAHLDRVIQVFPGVTAVIEGVTITGGSPIGFQPGGGIYSEGTLEVVESRITGNRFNTSPSAGAIYNGRGQLLVNRSTIDNNEQIRNCSGWCFVFSGAITNSGSARVVNSTLSSNSAEGIFSFLGTVDVDNSTIVNNRGTGSTSVGEFRVRNSILEGPVLRMTDLGNNLIGVNAGLAPLQFNGGSTPTHALLEDSPAIDAGSNSAAPLTDQRGRTRPQDGDGDGNAIVDIGAFEFEEARPIAEDDTYRVDEDNTLRVIAAGVLSNDKHPAAAPLTARLVSGPAVGTLQLNSDGSFTYTPEADFHGTAEFTYRASDGSLESRVATVTVIVNSVNDAPVASADTYYVAPGDTLIVPAPGVIANDTDVDQDALTAVKIGDAAHGTVVLDQDGRLVYTPDEGFEGTDSFSYAASDSELHSDAVTVTIHVQAITVTTTADEDDGSLGGGLGISLREAIRYAPQNAVIDLPAGRYPLTRKGDYENAGSTGDLDITRNLTIHGAGAATTTVDAFPLSSPVADGLLSGDRVFHVLPNVIANIRGVTIKGGVPDASPGDLNAGGGILNEGQLTLEDSVVRDNHAVGFARIQTPRGEETRQLSGGGIHNTGSLTVVRSTITGNDVSERFTTCILSGCRLGQRTGGEGGGIWNSGDVTLVDSHISANDAHNGGGISNKGLLHTTNVVISDNTAVDFGGGIHSISLATDQLDRTTIAGNTALYGGGINTHGTITIIDSTFEGNAAVPRAGLSEGGGLLLHGSATISGTTFLGNTSDLGGGLQVNSGATAHVANSTLSGNTASTFGGGVINRFSGDLTLVNVTVTNNAAESGGGIYVEFAPVVIDNSIIAGNTASAHGSDVDGVLQARYSLIQNSRDVLFVDESEHVIPPAAGNNLTNVDPRLGPLQDNGGWTLTHALEAGSPAVDTGSNALALDAAGQPLASDQRGSNRNVDAGGGATVDIGAFEVQQALPPTNNFPVAQDDGYSGHRDIPLIVDAAEGVLANDSDRDGDQLTALLRVSPQYGQVTLNADGSFSYQPNPGFDGIDSFTYVAHDGSDESEEATVHLLITIPNEPPVARDDAYQVDQDITLNIHAPGLLTNDFDSDADPLVVLLGALPAHGSLSLRFDGSFTYTPDAGYFGVDSFTYTVTDGLAESNLATVTIEVSQVVPPAKAKFLVVDASLDEMFEYDADGLPVGRHPLGSAAARGTTSSPDGTTRWVLHGNGMVTVYDQAGNSLGQWQAEGLRRPEGIATDGGDVWIVDRGTDRVYRFQDAASRLDGSQSAAGSFALATGNRNPRGITTDGRHLWVVNDARLQDNVFRYTTSGVPAGRWTIDSRNASPTGITIDPSDINHIWIVDAAADQVFAYHAAADRTSGSQLADVVFDLAAENVNPQGIADPLSDGAWTLPEATNNPRHNSFDWLDVNGDGSVTPLDALLVINRINQQVSEPPTESEPAVTGIYQDVNNDRLTTALDALLVINYLNRPSVEDPLEAAFEETSDWTSSETWLTLLAEDDERPRAK